MTWKENIAKLLSYKTESGEKRKRRAMKGNAAKGRRIV
jgi:hypothetical protein